MHVVKAAGVSRIAARLAPRRAAVPTRWCSTGAGLPTPPCTSTHYIPYVAQHNTAEQAADDRDLDSLVENNRLWVDGVNQKEPNFFPELAKPQTPKFLYIGCSDSRVDPCRLLGLKPGDLFVHRNVGNCCPNDLNFLSVLEYAVRFLQIPHIIVCGHYDCGAVRGALKNQDTGLLENWLRQIRDVHRLHDTELSSIEDEEAKHRRFVELNVVEQCRNIFKTACVQRHRQRTASAGPYPFATPRIHAMTFDPADGVLNKLSIDFKEDLKQHAHIYNLYPGEA